MKTYFPLMNGLSCLHQAFRRIIVRAKLKRCIADLAHIEATRQNDLHAERIRLREMMELKSILRDMESNT